MPYIIGNNYTDSEIKSYPSAAAGPTAASGVAWAEGALVEIVPVNTIAVDFTLLTLIAYVAPLAAIDTRHQGVYNIYDDGVLIASVPFDFYIDSALGHSLEQFIPLPPKRIAANSRIQVSVACSAGIQTFGGFKIQYFETVETYTNDPIRCYPYLAAGPSPVSNSAAWTWGTWLELVPINTIAFDFDICTIIWLFPPAEGTVLDTRYQGVIQIGVGGAPETPIISLPVTFLIDTKAEHVPAKNICYLPIPRRVPAKSRVAVRVCDSLVAGQLTWGPIKIEYVKSITTYQALTATAVGVASLAKIVTYYETLAATALGVATMILAKMFSVTIAATALGVATISRVTTFVQSLPAIAIGLATLAKQSTFYQTLSATAMGVATLAKIATYYVTMQATAAGVPGLTKKMFKSLSATAIGQVTLDTILTMSRTLAATAIGQATLTRAAVFKQILSATAHGVASIGTTLIPGAIAKVKRWFLLS